MTVPHWFDPRTMDLFEFWRFILTAACLVYATIVTLQSLWGWVLYLAAPQRPMVVLRKYVIVQMLRLRARRFAGELLAIFIWSASLIAIIRLH